MTMQSIGARAQAIYDAEVLSCGSGMMPEWDHLDPVGRQPWIERAQAELDELEPGQMYPCDGGVYRLTSKPNQIPIIVAEPHDEHPVLVKACIVRGQQLYETETGKGASWDELDVAHKLQWVALAQAEFLSAHAQLTPQQFLDRCGEDSSWQ